MNLQIKRALHELNNGKLMILEDFHGQGKLVGLADKVSSDMINFMIKHGKGLVSVGVEQRRAQQLDMKLQEQTSYSHDDTQAFTVSVDVEETTTGISAYERYQTIKALTDNSRKPEDFKRPGHVFPVIAHPNGLFANQSHIELGLHLASINESYPAVVLCDILNISGEIATARETEVFARKHGLSLLQAKDVLGDFLMREKMVTLENTDTLNNFIGEFTLSSYSNELDTITDHVIHTKSVDTSVTPVYVHKQCSQCEAMTCNCYYKFQSALSQMTNIGGICLQMKHRRVIPELLPASLDYFNILLTANILKDMGIQKVQLINDSQLYGNALQELGINVVKESVKEQVI